MQHLIDRFARLETTNMVLEAVARQTHRAVGGLWGSSAALMLAALRQRRECSVLAVCADDEDAQALEDDLRTFGSPAEAVLPRQLIDADGMTDPSSLANRVRVLSGLALVEKPMILASLESLLQPAPQVQDLGAEHLDLRTGAVLERMSLLATFRDAGLRKVPVVAGPGEVSLRGDVLDVFPLTSAQAVRIEFFDDEVESIRGLEVASGRSVGEFDHIALPLGRAGGDRTAAGSEPAPPSRTDHVIKHLFRTDIVVGFLEPLRIQETRNRLCLDRSMQNALVQFQQTLHSRPWLELSTLPSQDLDFKVLTAGSGVGSGEADPVGRLRAIRGLRGEVHICCRTDAEKERLREIFSHKGVDASEEQVHLHVGGLGKGFRIPDLATSVITNLEFMGAPPAPRVRARQEIPSRAVQSFFELGPGDLVVHAVHGIALFEGTERVARGESEEEHLKLIFKDDVRLLVPVSKIHLVQKYVGAGQANPPLDKLGGKGFQKRKAEVEKSLYDLAADLLEVQAKREEVKRPPYPRDPLEDEFLDGFPFADTPDQATAWKEIRADLERDCPMDRLVCGDVGFGKTELAMRTAFKVAITGRQVAVLVPTTLLAEQHGKTFASRFEPHGLRVESLSRFRPLKERRAVLEALAAGTVDVLVGTHRILSNDVAFSDLGLMIVDEEQRFGVRQKEKFKQNRVAIDFLALSATPIPRTLHGSLLGIRAVSTLTTPPPGRQDVETRVAWRDQPLLQESLEHELQRQGQAFIVHDRISGLDGLCRQVQEVAPEATITTAHGQMTEAQMEKTVKKFVDGEIDILISTSIVENGLDIARANTILIDRAELFGMAELHQLRGRVGRSDRKAYCFLLMDRLHPPSAEAKRRLRALEEFSGLGAGFAIAMKDLEIRGAGNILGPQQSGHIAAIGYDMYRRLLEQAVTHAKSDTPRSSAPSAALRLDNQMREVDVDLGIRAFLPDSFAQETKERLELLRRMDDATSPEGADEVRAELQDRFGSIPHEVENLLRVFLLKHLLMQQSVLSIQRPQPDRIVVRHPPDEPLGGAWLDAFADHRPVEAGKSHLLLPRAKSRSTGSWSGEAVLDFLLDTLGGVPRRSARRRRKHRAETEGRPGSRNTP